MWRTLLIALFGSFMTPQLCAQASYFVETYTPSGTDYCYIQGSSKELQQGQAIAAMDDAIVCDGLATARIWDTVNRATKEARINVRVRLRQQEPATLRQRLTLLLERLKERLVWVITGDSQEEGEEK